MYVYFEWEGVLFRARPGNERDLDIFKGIRWLPYWERGPLEFWSALSEEQALQHVMQGGRVPRMVAQQQLLQS